MKLTFNNSEDGQEEVISEINVTPLVDVMLLLMIIFLVTAPLLINNIDVKLPQVVGASESKAVSKIIAIKENGDLSFDGSAISAQSLEKELIAISSKEVVVKIAADKNCRYQDVAAVLSLLGKSHISNVSFLTQN